MGIIEVFQFQLETIQQILSYIMSEDTLSTDQNQYAKLKHYRKLKGLRNNDGRSCFMSSVLQNIFSILNQDILPQFCRRISVLLYLFIKLRDNRSNFNYEMFKNQLSKKLPMIYSQEEEDAQEFLTKLIQVLSSQTINETQEQPGIEEEIDCYEKKHILRSWVIYEKQLKKSFISGKFFGHHLIQIRCHGKHDRFKFEPFQSISLYFPTDMTESSIYSVKTLLQNTMKPQKLPRIFCSRCNKVRKHQKLTTIFEVPEILILYLVRTRYNELLGESERINNQVRYDQELMVGQGISRSGIRYRLKGTVSHVSDNVYSGHYVGKVREKGDRWLRYDDEKVTESRVKKTENYSKLIYILFYERSKE